MIRKLLKDAGTHALLFMLLLIMGLLAFYLLLPRSPIETVEARPAGYLSSAGERAHEQNWEPITYNLAARWVFTHTPKLVHIVNDSGSKGYVQINSSSLNVTTPTGHILIQDNGDLWLDTSGDKQLQVSSIDFILWNVGMIYTIPLTSGTQIEAADWWASAWW